MLSINKQRIANQPRILSSRKDISKMSKKKVTKKTSSVGTIASLRKSVPAFSVGALGQKVIIYLIENKGTSFTSYEIHSVVGNENTTDKAVRDFMRKMGFLGLIYYKNGVKSEFWGLFYYNNGFLGQFLL